jgi:sodium/potassium-transporting ATPase subunit beta
VDQVCCEAGGNNFSGVLINIECKAWAHNVRHDRAERRGSVHFELMVD